jgi:outer membrane receptor protein involved in Fe transport
MKRKWFYRPAFFALPVLGVLSMSYLPALGLQKGEVVNVMDMSLEDLLKVEITTASKKPEKVIDIPASVVIVTRADIEKYGYQTLAEVLENIPGLYQTDDFSTQNFGVRGFWSIIPQRNIIILVNGVPQTDVFTSGNLIQQINLPVEAIDRIEVVRGPMSVIYGTGAFFGVINIKTNIVQSYKPLTLVSASIGSEQTHKLFTRASGKERDFQYSFNASYSHTDGLDVPYTDIGDPATLANWGINPGDRTAGQLKNSEKYFNFAGQFKGFSFDSSFTEADRGVIAGLPSIADGTMQNNRAMRVAFGYKKEFSKKLALDARFGYFTNRIVFAFKWLLPNFLGSENDESRAYNAEVNLFFSPSPSLEITAGLNYRKTLEIKNEVNAPAIGVTLWTFSLARGESSVTQAFFTQADYKISSKLKIVAGFRLEQAPAYKMQLKKGHIETSDYSVFYTDYSYTKTEFIPRLALIYNLGTRNVFKLLYGKAINRPSFSQMAEEIYYTRPDLHVLRPETIQTLELNYLGQFSSSFSVSASLFRNMLDHLIFRTLSIDNSTGLYSSYFDNVGKMNTTGVEITVQANPLDNLTFELSGTYQETKDKRHDVKNPPGYSPHFLGYFKTAYSLNSRISLAVTGNYVGPMESYYDVTMTDDQGKPTPKRLGQKVDGYFLLGANLSIKKLFGTGMFLNLRGSNLLDQKVYYPTTSNNNLFAAKGTVGRGISFLLTLGWKF